MAAGLTKLIAGAVVIMVKFLVELELVLPARSVQLMDQLSDPTGSPVTLKAVLVLFATDELVWFRTPLMYNEQLAVGDEEV